MGNVNQVFKEWTSRQIIKEIKHQVINIINSRLEK